jgi:formate-dependent phosphoribosylglycinamide formyltransferase (GAR transformylase)
MMIAPAIDLGIELKVLAETENSSAAAAATLVGDFTDLETVTNFAKTVDVITFDHEHVPISVLEQLEKQGISVQPPSKALAHAQNKLVMRKALEKIDRLTSPTQKKSASMAFDIDVPKLVAPGAGSITFPPVPCRDSAVKVGLWTARVIGPPADIVADVWKVAVPELVPVDTVIEPLVVVRLA